MVKKNPQNLSEIQNRLYEIYHNEIAPLMIDWEKKRKSEVFKFVFILCAICLPNGTYPSGDFLQYGKCYQCDHRICCSGYPWYS